MLTAGFHKTCISPEPGLPLAGYAAREGVCTGVHDDLFARALVLEEDGRTLVLVSLDLLAVSDAFVRRGRSLRGRRSPRQRSGSFSLILGGGPTL